MNVYIFTKWLQEINLTFQKQKRKIRLFLDNIPVHSSDIQLRNIPVEFVSLNTTAKIQPVNEGMIRTFKAHYHHGLVQHNCQMLIRLRISSLQHWMQFVGSIPETERRRLFLISTSPRPDTRSILPLPTCKKSHHRPTLIDKDFITKRTIAHETSIF